MKPIYHVQSKDFYGDWKSFPDGITSNKKQAIRWTIKARERYRKEMARKGFGAVLGMPLFGRHIRLIERTERTIPVPRIEKAKVSKKD